MPYPGDLLNPAQSSLFYLLKATVFRIEMQICKSEILSGFEAGLAQQEHLIGI